MVPSAFLNIIKDRGQHVSVIICFKQNVFRTIAESVLWDAKTDIARRALLAKLSTQNFIPYILVFRYLFSEVREMRQKEDE